MPGKLRIVVAALTAAALFCGGSVLGSWNASRAAAANKFGTPSTIIHISLIKWKAGVSDADKQKALDGVKELAAQIPGVKNVWTKAVRMQPRDYHAAFVIEFENRDAADRYATHPAHEAWSKGFLEIREASISPQVSN
jgi:hypothetical protein